jgi:hypothetical protein
LSDNAHETRDHRRHSDTVRRSLANMRAKRQRHRRIKILEFSYWCFIYHFSHCPIRASKRIQSFLVVFNVVRYGVCGHSSKITLTWKIHANPLIGEEDMSISSCANGQSCGTQWRPCCRFISCEEDVEEQTRPLLSTMGIGVVVQSRAKSIPSLMLSASF